MRLLITGASGFLGRAIIRAAIEAGHEPIALVRPSTDTDGFGWPDRVRIVRGDLLEPGHWTAALRDVEAVAHAAAVMSGDPARQFAGTVTATEKLLNALDLPNLRRFVHVSSFSVYDFAALERGAVLTEDSPVETRAAERDGYTVAKLAQERLVAETCGAAGVPFVILRPGAIFGPGRDWGFGRALRLGPIDFVFAPNASLRLTYVDNCADAVVAAVTAPLPSGGVINVVDDELPDHATYHRLSRRSGAKAGSPVHMPWPLVAAAGAVAETLNRLVLGGRVKLPELLAPRRQQARWKPIRYDNERARRLLGWTPRVSMREAIRRTVSGEER